MSYEGYEQILCQNGHYNTIDAMETMYQDGYKPCEFCQSPIVWFNCVDTTNDDGSDYIIDLKEKISATICTCHCGNQHQISPAIYEIPEKQGHKI